MIINANRNWVVAGADFDLTLDDVEAFLNDDEDESR
jgi:hypothetical protein